MKSRDLAARLVRATTSTNPIPWMGWLLGGLKHDSFFEKKVTDYTHIKLPGSVSYGKYLN